MSPILRVGLISHFPRTPMFTDPFSRGGRFRAHSQRDALFRYRDTDGAKIICPTT